MQSAKGLVNALVVIILEHYKICSFRTRRSIRDYKVNESGGHSAGAKRRRQNAEGETVCLKRHLPATGSVSRCFRLADPVAGKRVAMNPDASTYACGAFCSSNSNSERGVTVYSLPNSN